MATVCGCCLAMLDAGVPLKTSVAGVAMGLILGKNIILIIPYDNIQHELRS